MNILITGGAGFIGSNIADRFISDGFNVIIVDNLISGKLVNVNKKAKFYHLDIRDKEIEKIFQENNIDIICHHAAQMDVRKSVDDPGYDANVNIIGALNLMEFARKYKVKKVIFASTGGAIYGEQEYFPADEKHITNPLSPYGISKLAFEKYLFYYQKTYDINYTILRYANVYGPRQDPHGEAGVVAIFSKKILLKESPTINGDGEQTRDYTFVKDVVEANVLAATQNLKGIFNIGTGIETSVNTLCQTMIQISGHNIKTLNIPAKIGEQLRSVLSSDKIKKKGWKPIHDLKTGLTMTLEYFKNK